MMSSCFFQDPLRPLILGGDHSISYPIVRAVSEKLGGQIDLLHLDAHPDLYDSFEGNKYSHASSFARIMEGGYVRRLLQVISKFQCFYPPALAQYLDETSAHSNLITQGLFPRQIHVCLCKRPGNTYNASLMILGKGSIN